MDPGGYDICAILCLFTPPQQCARAIGRGWVITAIGLARWFGVDQHVDPKSVNGETVVYYSVYYRAGIYCYGR